MDLKKIVKEELVSYLNEYGAPAYTDEEMSQALSPMNDQAIDQILKAKDNYFEKKPASFYEMDMFDSSGEEMQLSGQDILNYVTLTLKDSKKSNTSPYREVVAFLETLL